MTKKAELKFSCAACGKEVKHDEARSNDNWKVAPKECNHCGSSLVHIVMPGRSNDEQ